MTTSDALSPRLKAKFAAYVPRQRQPGEAMPYHINTFAGKKNQYKADKLQSVRPGADDHRRIQSRGVPT